MLLKQNIKTITEDDLATLNSFVSTPFIMFNYDEIVYISNYCRLLFEYDNSEVFEDMNTNYFFKDDKFIDNIKNILESSDDININETYIITKKLKKVFIKLEYRLVLFNSEKYILAHLFDITEKINVQRKLAKLSMVRSLMLDISQSIVKIEDIDQIYELILNNANKALEKANIGTIFIKDNDIFKVVAHAGFSEEIVGFHLKIQDSFLYRASNGKMDTIQNIGDLMVFNNYYPIKTKLGEKEYIKSTITAPIIVNGNLYGSLNIDSVEINAFDDDDIQYMVFIKSCIEIAISNFLLYNEKIYLSKHDSLTKLYNRFYIEEKFERSKTEAINKNSNFYLVIFDIDDLKNINDKYGHSVGDRAILKVVKELNKIVDKKDTLARVGGDEFLGIFYEESEESLYNKINNVLININNNINFGNIDILCSFSFGISTFGKDGYTFKKLFKVADDKMYMLKRYRKN